MSKTTRACSSGVSLIPLPLGRPPACLGFGAPPGAAGFGGMGAREHGGGPGGQGALFELRRLYREGEYRSQSQHGLAVLALRPDANVLAPTALGIFLAHGRVVT